MGDKHTSGKVHFTEDVSFDLHAVHCITKDNNSGEIDLGLLQGLHTYIVSFDMEHCLGDQINIPHVQSLCIQLVSVQKLCERQGHHVVLEVKCNEDESLNEELAFQSPDEQIFNLKVHAKIMAHHLGTPALKSGIKLLHKTTDASSNADSDWQGFT